jgi:8-amino-7-oxononanoate synthase
MRRDPRALSAALAERERAGLARLRHTIEQGAPGAHATQVMVAGERLINFCSNDYLGLAQHPALAQALSRTAARYGVGARASHLVCGHGPEHAQLEVELAHFTGRERALLFSTGYMANLGVITTLCGRGDLLLEDRLNHASLLDAARLCGARVQRYAHADAAAATRLLEQAQANAPGEAPAGLLLATDGLFSMDGDLAPLPQLAAAAAQHQAWLVVDDAHGFAVLGSGGRGTLEHFGLTPAQVPVLVGTFGKALGTFGAFVAGDAELIELLLQKARTYIYTTALPQALAAATRAALATAIAEPWRRTRVLELVQRFRSGAAASGITLGASATPVQVVILGDVARTLAASAQLRRAGFWVSAIRPPTVPPGTARLRITLSAAHAEADVDALVAALAATLRCLPEPAPS